ncbi:extensin [Streptomyces sp. NPDC005917]|uniref:extensin n=1 Tax=unclassified Streptomyces TaxID=2593676 RepID=UPI0033D4F5CD
MAPLPPFVQRAATPPAALPVRPSTSAPTPAHPVALRPTTPISATTPLPVAPLNRPTIQRDALTTALPPDLPTTTLNKAPVTSATTTRAERQPPPPDDPPPGYSGSGSGSSAGEPPPGYTAVEGGGFDPRALTEFQVDALVHRIIDRITRHVRTELRRDRERVGKLRDFRP